MIDTLADGSRFARSTSSTTSRASVLAIEVDRSLLGARVVLVLERRRALDGARRLPPPRPDGLKTRTNSQYAR